MGPEDRLSVVGSHVEAQIAARISRVKAEGERRRAERAMFAERRRAGVTARNKAKLARLHAVAVESEGDDG